MFLWIAEKSPTNQRTVLFVQTLSAGPGIALHGPEERGVFMKKSLVLTTLVMLSAPSVWASGSTNYICAAEKSNVRYDYNESDEIGADLYRVVGINKKQAMDLVKQNSLSLDAFALDGLLKRGHVISVDGCSKNDNDPADYQKCMSNKGAADVKTDYTTEDDAVVGKIDRIVQTVTLKDGTKIALSIHDYGQKSSDGTYVGTLAISGTNGEYKDLSLTVDCNISFP
jgi:hypothetical protein